ncbi:hypothetical protein [Aminiphilus circumscriptus]|jgi:hypothetical protein|uniref:hypothetical protein n=1 Tax=Aminiphilus circumscriptus TaxID=290732 RepID=UPI000478577A|nr:hypothetical protein [Aminiphilus circumscriptus]
MRKTAALFLLALAVVLGVAFCAAAEVQLFVDKQTVRVHDPALNTQSILNDFQPKGWRTHNYLALAWNDTASWIYDIRTHQWLSLTGFGAVAGVLSDNYAMVWEPKRVAIFDAKDRRWVVSDFLMDQITTPLIARGMGAAVTLKEFVVFDPVLREWKILNDVYPKQAIIGDNLGVCWNEADAFVYDTTVHQWVEKRDIRPQACIVEDYKVSIYTADRIFVYDAMKHRWTDQPR